MLSVVCKCHLFFVHMFCSNGALCKTQTIKSNMFLWTKAHYIDFITYINIDIHQTDCTNVKGSNDCFSLILPYTSNIIIKEAKATKNWNGSICKKPNLMWRGHIFLIRNEDQRHKLQWFDWCFRPRFCIVRLYWAGDNLGRMEMFVNWLLLTMVTDLLAMMTGFC